MLRIGMAQIDPTVGDFEGNLQRLLEAARRADAQGARLVVFPELAVCGYPPRDLLERECFVSDGLDALRRLAAEAPAGPALVVGFVSRAGEGAVRMLHNSVAVVQGGEVRHVVHKRLLPSYDVFDEDRYFEPGGRSEPIEIDGVRIGLTVCEDIWNDVRAPIAERRYGVDPVNDLRQAGAQLIINVSASPFTLPKRAGRPAMLSELARQHALPVVFVNQVGGNDDLLFDGDSAIYGPQGQTWARLPRFREDLAVVEVGPQGPVQPSSDSDEEAALDALAMGVRDYARKCGFRSGLIGLSGGIDSALTACIAARGLGADNVLGVAMPTRYSSSSSLDDARQLASALGIHYREIPIDDIYQTYLDHLRGPLDTLATASEGEATFENVQARIRGNTLMAISNRTGALLLSTGNKSEIAVGYCTLYGDMAGGLAVISDVPKTFVYRLAREANRQAGRPVIPESTLTKPPSAELRPDQKDTDSLPAYERLDPILERYIEDRASVDALVAEGFDAAEVSRVIRLVQGNEYKRRQMPPGLILTRKAFGPGRRYPIAQRYDR